MSCQAIGTTLLATLQTEVVVVARGSAALTALPCPHGSEQASGWHTSRLGSSVVLVFLLFVRSQRLGSESGRGSCRRCRLEQSAEESRDGRHAGYEACL
ncbi:hypothetical protein IWZ03DRAFT_378918 [Phyllosticta citriasiana]|uniref:Secreted protein n=1 Tax=Phyllosticta citriasiana TaxID=595635 RepID=A0ABR1KKZ0_9PEZI